MYCKILSKKYPYQLVRKTICLPYLHLVGIPEKCLQCFNQYAYILLDERTFFKGTSKIPKSYQINNKIAKPNPHVTYARAKNCTKTFTENGNLLMHSIILR